jgi:4-aminobutyrate aminotransferase-like enzyme
VENDAAETMIDAEKKSIEHPGEAESNAVRRRSAAVEPAALRTYTPSLAVLAKSQGSYHWTPEGRKLADFTSGVLVANLGHNPTRWWKRVLAYLGISSLSDAEPYHAALTWKPASGCWPISALSRAAGGWNK